MFYRLPPVGNPVVFESSANYESFLNSLFSPYQPFYFNSGAAALAAGLMVLIRQQKLKHAEVLLPAYACPEIVSAVLYAGGTPVLVDLEKDTPWMDLELLENGLNDSTIAVVAVSLFGIPERIVKISSILKHKNVFLVEDNAQCFLFKGKFFKGKLSEGKPVDGKPIQSESDVVIFSFGRGKPVSVLGGGVALVKDDALVQEMKRITVSLNCIKVSRFKLRSKVWLYNQFISPYLYWIPDSLPFLRLGETRFRSLQGLSVLSGESISLLPANIQRYWQQGLEIQSSVMQMLVDLGKDEIVDLAVKTCGGALPRLLRYPVLLDTSALRDELYLELNGLGLGVSKMYPTALPGITGLGQQFAGQSSVSNAESFASRILTLPVHQGVQVGDVERTGEVIRNIVLGIS